MRSGPFLAPRVRGQDAVGEGAEGEEGEGDELRGREAEGWLPVLSAIDALGSLLQANVSAA